MLSDLSLVSKLFFDEPESGWFFNEIAFDDEAIAKFKQLPLDLEILEHSARLQTSPNSHAYLPCHYFLYALKLRPLALMLHNYVSLKELVVSRLTGNTQAKAVALETLVASPTPNNATTNTLDLYSRENFFNFFRDGDKRLGAKMPINSGRGVIRTDTDIFVSVILKALPVPDESSNALGRLINAFSKSPQVYEYLINRYARSLPYILKSNNGDELLYLIFVTLGLENHLTTVLAGLTSASRVCAIGTVKDALLLNTTPVSGNPSYYDTPIHYEPPLKAYVFFKKGLLDEEVLLKEISNNLTSFWPYAFITHDEGGYYLRAVSELNTNRVTGGFNKIIYGAPGTGKSHAIEQNTNEQLIIRTVFHPETQYSDFVGSLKPVMEDNRIAYRFRLGVFTEALVKAAMDPSQMYRLIIEEINRAPAAAVFGELFQLLDRNTDGSSRYKIDISDPDLLTYLNSQTNGYFSDGKLSIPSNLSLLATMNSSDQAVMPLDTAFKRRWSFEYVQLNFEHAPHQVLELQTSEGLFKITWAKFVEEVLNKMLKEFRVSEDRLVGPFFFNETELKDWQSSLRGKLFVYLWDDVLRHKAQERARLFSDKFRTFGELYNNFPIGQVFGTEPDNLIREHGTAIENNDG